MATEHALPKKAYKDLDKKGGIYCMKCREKHLLNKPTVAKTKKGQYMVKDVCKQHGNNTQVFVGAAQVKEWSKL